MFAKSGVAATLKTLSSQMAKSPAMVKIMPSFMLVRTYEALSKSLILLCSGWLPKVNINHG